MLKFIDNRPGVTVPGKTVALVIVFAFMFVWSAIFPGSLGEICSSAPLTVFTSLMLVGTWLIARKVGCQYKCSQSYRMLTLAGICLLYINVCMIIVLEATEDAAFMNYSANMLFGFSVLWFLACVIVQWPTRDKRISRLKAQSCVSSVDSLLLCGNCLEDMTRLDELVCPKCGKEYMLSDLVECNAKRVKSQTHSGEC